MTFRIPHLVCISGNIGAGKSTLLTHIEQLLGDDEHRRVRVAREPVDKWQRAVLPTGETLFEAYYREPHKWSAHFQHYALTTRINDLVVCADSPIEICVCERTPDDDRHVFCAYLHDTKCISDADLCLIDWARETFWLAHMAEHVRLHIFLHTSPHKCYERVVRRARAGEQQHIQLATLHTLDKYLDEYEKRARLTHTCLRVDNETDDARDLEMVARRIVTLIRATLL